MWNSCQIEQKSNVLAGRLFKTDIWRNNHVFPWKQLSGLKHTNARGESEDIFGRGGSDVTDRAAPEGSCRYKMK